MQTRLRNMATPNHRLLISTNPDMNWIRQEVLLKSDSITGETEKYIQDPRDIDPNIATHIAPTELNVHLPPNYVEDLKKGKPEWWVKRYLEGSFNFSEGSVYPNFPSAILEPEKMTAAQVRENIRTKGWRVIGGGDFGIRDNTVLLQAALDPYEGIVYVYDEYVQNRVGIPTHAKEMKRRLAHIPVGALMKLVGDPSGKRKNLSDNRSVFSHYAEYGIHFQEGDNRIDVGIGKVFSYLEMGKLKVLACCKETVKEHSNYVYKPVDLGDKIDEKPIDKNNHTVDSLRYMIQELPDDPDQLRTQTYGADSRSLDQSQAHLPYELRTDDNVRNYAESWSHHY